MYACSILFNQKVNKKYFPNKIAFNFTEIVLKIFHGFMEKERKILKWIHPMNICYVFAMQSNCDFMVILIKK